MSRKRSVRAVPDDDQPRSKRTTDLSNADDSFKTSSDVPSTSSYSEDWMTDMGNALTEMLDRTANKRRLKANQVKKVLREILTNEDIISAFRMIMSGDLSLEEPETKNIKDSFHSGAKDLEKIAPNALNYLVSNPVIAKGVLTRSRTLNRTDAEGAEPPKKRPNILTVEFPDNDEDDPDFLISSRSPRSPSDPAQGSATCERSTDNSADEDEDDARSSVNSQAAADTTITNHDFPEAKNLLEIISPTCASPHDINQSFNNDDAVYADFLKNLFSDTDAQNATESLAQVNEFDEAHLSGENFMDVLCPLADLEDDPEDPEFDVMAELDRIYEEDFFDELRFDRGVRVSKNEARVLHRELLEMFDDDNFVDEAESEEDDEDSAGKKATHMPHFDQSKKPPVLPQRLRTLGVNAAYACNQVLADDLKPVLERQIRMHIQQLVTQFLCCSHLEPELKMAESARILLINLSHELKQVAVKFWSTGLETQLEEALKIISNFGGIQPVPQPLETKKFIGRLVYPVPLQLASLLVNSLATPFAQLLPMFIPLPQVVAKMHYFTLHEDTLLLFGLADFSSPSTSIYAVRTNIFGGSKASSAGPQILSRIQKHLLRHRRTAELRRRRNYLADVSCAKGEETQLRKLLAYVIDLSTQSNEQGYQELQRIANMMADGLVKQAKDNLPLSVDTTIYQRFNAWSQLPRFPLHKLDSYACVLNELSGVSPKDFGHPSAAGRLYGSDQVDRNLHRFVTQAELLLKPEFVEQQFSTTQRTNSSGVLLFAPREAAKVATLERIKQEPRPTTSSDILDRFESIVQQKMTNKVAAPTDSTVAPNSRPQVTVMMGRSEDNDMLSPCRTAICHSVNAFYAGLNGVLAIQTLEEDAARAPKGKMAPVEKFNRRMIAQRFKTRCSAQGRITSSDALLNLNDGPTDDASDLRKACSFLQRCRFCLVEEQYTKVVTILRDLETASRQSDFSATAPETLDTLERVLRLLAVSQPLWEDFILLLTPVQAKLLKLQTVHHNLVMINGVSAKLGEISTGRRFDCRLRNLASLINLDEHAVPLEGSADGSASAQNRLQQMSSAKRDLLGDRLRRRPVNKLTKEEVLTKTWQHIEPAVRRRLLLHSRMATILDGSQPPYSNIPEVSESLAPLYRLWQTFEENTALSRYPKKQLDLGENEMGEISRRTCLTVEDFGPLEEELRFELVDDLSAERGSSAGNIPSHIATAITHRSQLRPCHCSCHVELAPSGSRNRKKSAENKTQSTLNTRHCFNCGLRVHKGILYVDECNFHLNDVLIKWPYNFQKAPSSQNNCATAHAPPARDHFVADRQLHSTDEAIGYVCLEGGTADGVRPDLSKREVELKSIIRQDDEPLETTGKPSQTHCPTQNVLLEDDQSACFNTEAFGITQKS